jgi:DNA replication protein DnaC
MMNDNLDQLCKSLRLGRIPDILARELDHAQAQELGYGELLARLLRAEYMDRQERSMAARIKRARLPVQWTLETFPFKQQPGVKQAAIRDLAALDFIPRAANVVFIGPTGVGKTGLASALLRKALENGYRGLFIKAQELFDEMYASLADRSSRAMFNRLLAMDILLIDEMGYLNLRPEQTNLFFKLMDERYQRKPTIITTNLDYEQWYEFLGQKSMVEALLDRLRHHCHTIRIDGPSLRHPAG